MTTTKKDLTKISVIIPYYNTKQYTNKLMEILKNQIVNRYEKDVEVIVIDDGSKEGQEFINDGYSWLRVFRQDNKGVSAARNLGIREAFGKYIVFIDSDDLIAEDYFEKIITKIDEMEIDFDQIYFSWKSFGKWNVEVKLNDVNHKFPEWNCSVWNRVFKREMIINNNIKFVEGKQFAEDFDFIKEIENVSLFKTYITDILYYYRSDTPNSLSKRAKE